jgi:hypothetical protein
MGGVALGRVVRVRQAQRRCGVSHQQIARLGFPQLVLTVILLVVTSLPAHGLQQAVFADSAVAHLIALARARHQGRALALAGYRAKTFTRVEGRMAPSRFAPGLTVFAYETAADLHWAHPGNVRVAVRGARMAAPRLPGLSTRGQVTAFWEDLFGREPWFIPGSIGDEIQLMGIPDEEAVHPLARGAEAYYRYTLLDSVRLILPNRTVRAVGVRVEPRVDNPVVEFVEEARVDSFPADFAARLRAMMDSVMAAYPDQPGRIRSVDWRHISDSLRTIRPGDSVVYVRRPLRQRSYQPTLVAGEMWLDADSLDVVRMSVAFVGDGIWDDDPDSPRLVNLEADLEYGLHEGRFWLPLRQVLSANFVYRYLPGVNLPASAVTTFSDYKLDEQEPQLVFSYELPPGTTGRRFGSWNCPAAWEFGIDTSAPCGQDSVTRVYDRDDGTRWEVTLPPLDSLTSFPFSAEFEYTKSLAAEEFINERVGELARISEQLTDPTASSRFAANWLKVYDVFNFNRVQGPSIGFGYTWNPPIDFTTILFSGRFGFGDERPLGEVMWRRESAAGRFDIAGFRALNAVEPRAVGAGVGRALRTLLTGRDEADYHLATGGSVTYVRYSGPLGGTRLSLGFERQRSVSNVSGSWLNDFFFGSGTFRLNPAVREGDFLRLQASREFTVGPVNVEVGGDALASREQRGGRIWAGSDVWFTNGGRFIGRLRARGGMAEADSLLQLAFRVGGRNSVRGQDYGTLLGTSFWSGQLDLEWVVSQWWSPVAFADAGNVGRLDNPMAGFGIGISLLSGIIRFDLAKGINPSRPIRFDLLFQIPSL